MRPIVTLTTDFGIDDPFVGIMKGVLLSILPSAELIDITHQVEPQNVRQAAYIIQAAFSWFPKNTLHLVVVDPGVGGNRRPIAVQAGKHCFVAPDNGVLTPVLNPDSGLVYELTKPKYFLNPVSSTFHGRDIFAPAAAWIAKGTSLSKMGIRIYDSKTLDLPQPKLKTNTLIGEVVHIDRFGNLMSNIPGELLQKCFKKGLENLQIKISGKLAGPLVESYIHCSKGMAGCTLNSWGCLEIFYREDKAAKRFKSRIGSTITVTEKRSGK